MWVNMRFDSGVAIPLDANTDTVCCVASVSDSSTASSSSMISATG